MAYNTRVTRASRPNDSNTMRNFTVFVVVAADHTTSLYFCLN